MTEISAKVTIAAPADKVWQLVGDYAGLDKWHKWTSPYPTEGEGVGAIRTLKNANGDEFPEVLEEIDNEARYFIYSIPNEAPMPFSNYRSRLEVGVIDEGQCEFKWSMSFEPRGLPAEKVEEMLQGFLNVGVSGARKYFETT